MDVPHLAPSRNSLPLINWDPHHLRRDSFFPPRHPLLFLQDFLRLPRLDYLSRKRIEEFLCETRSKATETRLEGKDGDDEGGTTKGHVSFHPLGFQANRLLTFPVEDESFFSYGLDNLGGVSTAVELAWNLIKKWWIHAGKNVDDTVIFVPDKRYAEKVKIKHHQALRSVKLSPQPGKSQILPIEEYLESRHPEMNKRISQLTELLDYDENISFVTQDYEELVDGWYTEDRKATSCWDQIAKRLYTTGRNCRSTYQRKHVLVDLETTPTLTGHALRFLQTFEIRPMELNGLLAFWPKAFASQRIEIAKCLCDARFNFEASRTLSKFAVGRITQQNEEYAAGYLKGLLLLLLNKHGDREDRDRVLSWASEVEFVDEQLLLHYFYVFFCNEELDEEFLHKMHHLWNSDLGLTILLCRNGKDGRLSKQKEVRNLCFSKFNGFFTVPARYLPLLRLLLRCKTRRKENDEWLTSLPKSSRRWDRIALKFLKFEHNRLKS